MRDDAVYLRHILECIQRIEQNTFDGKAAFLKSPLLQDATLRNLQTMSESTQRLSAPRKALQPQIPWDRVSAFRNVVVHNYMAIDLEQIWSIIQSDVPALK